ncbi:hypothetical protein AVEN_66013-1 [Araneus ventricosus]|uniref:Uncharacterized protein n=1 Tax=Araneus ventricosus TaxID=182803 RepID=A0A4Y2R1D3_ARAVE|nr:hypothetical protein AVEN_66013-1 [Araneus ventricosus]
MLQDDGWDEWKQMEKDKRTKIEEEKRTKIGMISNDIEEHETYPIDIRHVPASIRRKRKEDLRQRYENDEKYVKELKEIIQGTKIEEDKRTNIESISNDIEENETYPIDIRHIPASIRRKHEKAIPQAYDDQKYLKEVKEMLKGNESYRDIEFEDDFLRLFITSNDYKIDQAFSKIQNFLNLRIDHNYFFHNVTFDFTQNPAYRFVTLLPHRRKDGSATILFELGQLRDRTELYPLFWCQVSLWGTFKRNKLTLVFQMEKNHKKSSSMCPIAVGDYLTNRTSVF